MSVATDLRAAADYLRTYGWIQGAYGDNGGPRCITGALMSVAAHDASAYDAAYEAARYVAGTDHHGLCVFNDEDCETADDAIAVLEIAAALATPSPEAANDHH